MTEGVVKDEISGNFYPDPLSLNYLKLGIPENYHLEKNLSESDIMFLWERAAQYYGTPEWDDIVLSYNGIPHINLLKEGDSLLFPSEGDITSAYTRENST